MYHTFPTGESDMEFTLRPNVDNPSTLSNMGAAGPTRVVGTNNSTLDNSWVVYDGTGTVTFNRAEWPVDGIYHNFSNFYACGVKEIMEIMFLVCKCIKHGISPQILIDIGDDLNG